MNQVFVWIKPVLIKRANKRILGLNSAKTFYFAKFNKVCILELNAYIRK